MNNDNDLVKINIEAAERRWIREEQKDHQQKKTIILITICIITIIGSSFIFSGMYENFFYEKGKNDLKSALNSLETNLKNYKPLNQNPKIINTKYKSKKWKRTTWEVYKGKACNEKRCLYVFDKKWRDCYIKTNICNTKTKQIKRAKKTQAASRTFYI